MMVLSPPPARIHRRKRAHHSGAITFCLVGAFVTILTVYSLLSSDSVGVAQHGVSNTIERRSLDVGLAEDLECRLVHRANDKCAFVRKHCLDEDSGLFSYLTFYYCRAPPAQPVAFAIIALWLCLLFSTIGIAASDFFCINLSTIATLLGLSESLAGVTFLAFGNGSPDVFSTFAAMSTNSGSLAVGELIGAASFITAVVAGSMTFVRPFKVARKSFVRDVTFFIIAASFSMYFLYDGKLYLWEAGTMVGIYVFYVIFVVTWHWWFNRRRRRREIEAAARAQFVAPGSEEAEFPPYHDDDDPENRGRAASRRGLSAEDFSALERGHSRHEDEDEDDEDEALEGRRRRWLGEINSDMRLSRPKLRERRLTHNPVRPSLIGALEFRSVLSGLHKSGNQSIPLNFRRYSDDAGVADGQYADHLSTVSDPRSQASYNVGLSGGTTLPSTQGYLDPSSAGTRARAVSAPDADALRLNVDAIPRIDLLGPLSEADSTRASPRQQGQLDDSALPPPSPSFSLSPPPSHQASRATSPAAPRVRPMTPSLLAPPDLYGSPSATQPKTVSSPNDSVIMSPTTKPNPKLVIPQSDSSAFPPYRDHLSPTGRSRASSIRLPSPSASPDSRIPYEVCFDESDGKPLKWWPYQILPSPSELWSTLFPTLCGWRGKNWWEKLLGVVAAPSVFLLTITLPVVETESGEETPDDDIPDLTLQSSYGPNELPRSRTNTVSIIIDSEEERLGPSQVIHHGNGNVGEAYAKGMGGHGTSATVAASSENIHQHAQHHLHRPPPHPHHLSRDNLPLILSPLERNITQSPDQLPVSPTKPAGSRDWTRWLICLQAFTAPLFMVLIIWAKMHPDEPKALIKPILISIACSLAALAFILTMTSATHAPKWRAALCFLGFAVSISWISTIADEVVGVLKSLGVILNMSDAILGLTIFAVGNSLGDLVADYTVAKLGYPVMALSACFGGPMLNILLGVGLSGLYLTIKGARKRVEKHPGQKMKFKPYHIEVSKTLMISGATLLVTLLGLLIVVPLRRWKMDRTIGVGLVVLWTVSTIGNVIVEVSGLSTELNGL